MCNNKINLYIFKTNSFIQKYYIGIHYTHPFSNNKLIHFRHNSNTSYNKKINNCKNKVFHNTYIHLYKKLSTP